VKHLHVGHLRRGVEPRDQPAALHGPGIAVGGHDHRHARLVTPRRRIDGVESTVHGRVEEVEQARVETDHEGLALGIAETGVELEHLGPLGGEHEPRVEHAVERHLRAAHGMDGGHEDPGLDVGQHVGVDEWRRAVGPHAAGVGAGVAVVGGLVVLEGRQCHDRAAVGDRQHAHLDAVEPLLDEDALAGRGAVRVGGERVHGLQRRGAVRTHEHPLAGREAVGLHDDRHVLAGLEILARPGRRGESAEHRGGHVAAMQDLLAEDLAALEPRGLGRGAEGAESRGAEGVDDAGDERRLGTDDGQIDGAISRRRDESSDVGGGDGHVLGDGGGARIARRTEHFRAVAGEFPGEGVFTAPAADDEDATGRGHSGLRDGETASL
jgi:hypothetical protein